MATEDAIRITIDELLKVLSARNIIGEPIEMDDKIILPITKMGMGFGTGMSPGREDKGGGGSAGGAGGGVGVKPIAVVIIFKGIPGPYGVKVVPLTTPSAMAESLAEITSAVMGRLKGRREGEKKRGTPVEVE